MTLRLLLTGEPKVGKSTILKNSLGLVERRSGFWTSERVREGQRYGFMVEASSGQSVILADTERQTLHSVGRYYVDVEAFEQFLQSLEPAQKDNLIYIDEIGWMQTLSPLFIDYVKRYMASEHVMVGTISKMDHTPFITEVKADPDTVLVEVTLENRYVVQKLLDAVTKNFPLLPKLNPSQSEVFMTLARRITDPLLLYKLFHNSLVYVAKQRVSAEGAGEFHIDGFTFTHVVKVHEGEYSCDCVLFRTHDACSHIFAAQIISAD